MRLFIKGTGTILDVSGPRPAMKGDRFRASLTPPGGATLIQEPGFIAISCIRGRNPPTKEYVYDPDIHQMIDSK